MAAAAAGAAAGAAKKAAGAAGGRGAAGAEGAGLPQRGSWRARAEAGSGRKGKSRILAGSAGRWRRMLIAEFLVAVMLLGLSPLAKAPGEMGPVRFMKRGSATCALFIILGLVSSMGRGAGKAAAAFGGLVVLVLLVDQREAFGKLATILADDSGDAPRRGQRGRQGLTDDRQMVGPDDSTDSDGPSLEEV